MFTKESVRKFLYKCEECHMILSAEFEEEEEIIKVQEDLVVLECPCGGKSKILRD